VSEQQQQYKPSRFNFKTRNSNNELVVYNSFTGMVGVVPPEEEGVVEQALKPNAVLAGLDGILADLQEGGVLVPAAEDEFAKAAQLHRDHFNRDDVLELTIMPTEECNFRCVYCYEDFAVKEMKQEIREGIKELIRQRAPKLKHMTVSWFGGEPTEAPDVIMELSEFIVKTCDEYGIEYRSAITTNGFNLKPELVQKLIEDCRIRHFNITIDGLEEEHNKRRIKKGGGETFQTILENLIAMKGTDYKFHCQLRTNFDRESLSEVPKLMDFLLATLEGDERFPVYYRNIGKWGGPNDDNLEVCDGSQGTKDMFGLHKKAKDKGLSLAAIGNNLSPNNHVCYAALPYHFVIGANGLIRKCTVALDLEANHVGQLDETGNLNINHERLALWTGSNETIDQGCQRCFYRPSCQGAACPLERIENGVQPCPPTKTHMKYALDVITS
jgi:uncharacterized protein